MAAKNRRMSMFGDGGDEALRNVYVNVEMVRVVCHTHAQRRVEGEHGKNGQVK